MYYGKNYTKFREKASVLLDAWTLPRGLPLEGLLGVSTRFVVRPPKTTKRSSPRGDVDNYFKTLDFLNGHVWVDDDQLIWASMTKEYGECPGIHIQVQQIERVPETRTLSQMWVEG